MEFVFSQHWKEKQKYRPDITVDLIEYCINESNIIRDKHWTDTRNAIVRVPSSGRVLKVIYRKQGKVIKVISAYWLD